MTYQLDITDYADKKFLKLAKKDKTQMIAVWKKINQILDNPYHFKQLKGDLKGTRRVHIMKSFVLIYEIDEENKVVRVLDYDHHDKVY